MDGLAVTLVNGDHSAQMTFVLRRTMAQDVALGSVGTLDGTAGTHFKALGGGFLGFHFRHRTDPLLIKTPDRRTGKTIMPGAF